MTGETQGARITRKLGGRLNAAQITGFPVTRIDSWKRTGRVPQDDWPHILALAEDNHIDLTVGDFIAHLIGVKRHDCADATLQRD